MKTAKNLRLLGAIACCLFGQLLFAQSDIVKDIDVQTERTQVTMNENIATSYVVEIVGPDEYRAKFEVEHTDEISLSPLRTDGTAFADGTYKMRITPTFLLTPEQQAQMLDLRQKGDVAALNRYMIDNRIPNQLDVATVNFGIRAGKFVSPDKHEGDMPPPTMFGKRTDFQAPEAVYASINHVEVNYAPLATDNSLVADDQVFADDVIINGGSLCVGFDCVNGESFGSDTQRLKENNLRLHFDDTSASASFPANDWRLVANDQTNGGDNYFAVEDATAGNIPFRVEAGAGANALHVDASGGNVGMGTNTPVVELHVMDGDSPTLRLEQNGASGFTPQTWDLAGNETNFFVRDVTNGSALPFKIRPGADDNALVIDNDNNIGIGILDATERLHIPAGNLLLGNGNATINGNTIVNGNARYALTNRANFLGADGTTVLQVDGVNNRVGIGLGNPDHLLELALDDAVKPGGGNWSAPSDRRLKTGIQDFEDGLAQVMAIRPVRFRYNGIMDMPTDQEFIGLIAQEIREVAPYTVRTTQGSEEGYLFVDGAPLTYILINAVQEQQQLIDRQDERIEELEAQLSEVAQLRREVAELAQAMKAQAPAAEVPAQNVSEKR